MEYTKEGAKPESDDSMVEWSIVKNNNTNRYVVVHHTCQEDIGMKYTLIRDLRWCLWCGEDMPERILKTWRLVNRMTGIEIKEGNRKKSGSPRWEKRHGFRRNRMVSGNHV